jgi:hypothetical protein
MWDAQTITHLRGNTWTAAKFENSRFDYGTRRVQTDTCKEPPQTGREAIGIVEC